MNTTSPTVSTSVETHHHPPHPARHRVAVPRVRFADRVALHLGLALITWSRRPLPSAMSHQLQAQRVEREWQAERRLRLTVPPR